METRITVIMTIFFVSALLLSMGIAHCIGVGLEHMWKQRRRRWRMRAMQQVQQLFNTPTQHHSGRFFDWHGETQRIMQRLRSRIGSITLHDLDTTERAFLALLRATLNPLYPDPEWALPDNPVCPDCSKDSGFIPKAYYVGQEGWYLYVECAQCQYQQDVHWPFTYTDQYTSKYDLIRLGFMIEP